MERSPSGVYHCALSGKGALSRLAEYGGCLRFLTLGSLKVRYRRSVLGFAWSLLYPLMSMAVLTVVFSRVFADLDHYALYVIVGVLAWGFFSLSCLQAMDSLISGAAVMRKVYVPSAVFPLSVVGANMINLLLSLSVLPLVMMVLGAGPGFHPMWLLAALLALAAFTAGVALALAALNLFFRDIRYFFEGLLLIWFYATPVVYPASVVPADWSPLLWLNPFHWLIALMRAALWNGAPPPAGTVAICLAFATVTLVAGWRLFVGLERRFYLYI